MRLIPSQGYIYLASPYSHPDPFVREMRYLWTMREMSKMMEEEYFIYSPIVHCHEVAKILSLPKEAEFWKNYNKTMLEAAQLLWVLRLDGWEQSVGIKHEVAYANSIGIEVVHVDPILKMPISL